MTRGLGVANTRPASWFAGLGSAVEAAELADDAALSRHDRGEWRESAPPDSRFLSRQARRIAGSGQSGMQRLYLAFVASRAALGVALLATEVVLSYLVVHPQPMVSLALCAAYTLAALGLWLLPQWLGEARPKSAVRLRRRQWFATIGVDLLAFGSLQLLSGGGLLNYSALLVMPVLMAGVLTPRLQALGVAAASTLIVLLAAGWRTDAQGATTLFLTQAGLAGAGLFVISLLAGELSGRLAREERTARGSLALARQQAHLNRLVLEQLQEGVMVVDRRGRVHAANPAARALIGEPIEGPATPFGLDDTTASAPLLGAIERAHAEGDWPEAGRDLLLPCSDGPRRVRLRMRFTQWRDAGVPEDYCVLFLEDERTVQARVRQEKLAAMGRVSAGIAHEIRNPLAAIMQANALMAEDADSADSADQKRLTRMVAENAERLKRIVDDMLDVAPGAVQSPAPLDATAQVEAICSEWSRTAQLPAGAASPLRVELAPQPLGVVFEGEHLRRVLVNLLDNALRHGSRAAGAVRVRLMAINDARALLSVASDGPVIKPEVERYLFEPFFSTRSRGTGLGLYICRELCERYGASIDYTPRGAPERHRNEFSVAMRRVPLAHGAAPLRASL